MDRDEGVVSVGGAMKGGVVRVDREEGVVSVGGAMEGGVVRPCGPISAHVNLD